MTISYVPRPGYVAFAARATPDGKGGYVVRHTYRKIECVAGGGHGPDERHMRCNPSGLCG